MNGNKIRNLWKHIYSGIFLAVIITLISNCQVLAAEDSSDAEKKTAVEVNDEETGAREEENASQLQVHYIDVGQGNATLVTCDGHAMLVDAGDSTKGTAIQYYLKKNNVSKLDYLILSHPDDDHIGGADVIVTKYDIDKIFMSSYENDTTSYEELLEALKYRKYKGLIPEVGDQYELGSAVITFVGPTKTYEDANNSSLSLILDYGESSFLFTGDTEADGEADLVDAVDDLDVDVYLVGHHGSKNSSTEKLLDAAKPEYAVISCEKENTYFHPSKEALLRLKDRDIKVYRTDEQGSLVATSDGQAIIWNIASSNTWKSGDPDEKEIEQETKNVSKAEARILSKDKEKEEKAKETATPTPKEKDKDVATPSPTKKVEAKPTKAVSPTPDPKKEAEAKAAAEAQAAAEAKAAAEAQAAAQAQAVAKTVAPQAPVDSVSSSTYILNTNSKKFHFPSCNSVKKMKEKNKQGFNGTRDEAIAYGYSPCGNCKP